MSGVVLDFVRGCTRDGEIIAKTTLLPSYRSRVAVNMHKLVFGKIHQKRVKILSSPAYSATIRGLSSLASSRSVFAPCSFNHLTVSYCLSRTAICIAVSEATCEECGGWPYHSPAAMSPTLSLTSVPHRNSDSRTSMRPYLAAQ
jgi:hypothetical protein